MFKWINIIFMLESIQSFLATITLWTYVSEDDIITLCALIIVNIFQGSNIPEAVTQTGSFLLVDLLVSHPHYSGNNLFYI